jgi:hypothetical protein
MGNRNLKRIGLSLLIALAFIVPAGSIMAWEPRVISPNGEGYYAGDITPELEKDLEAERQFDVFGMIDEQGNPVINQAGPWSFITNFFLDGTVVPSGDLVAHQDTYQPSVQIVNPGPGDDIVEPEIELYEISGGEEILIYETSFEDPCRNYMEWIQIDADCAIGGYYDGWAWSDARASDGDHSFKSTMYPEYHNCQEDYFQMQKGLYVCDQYAVRVEFDIWVAGEYGDWYADYWAGEIYTPLDYLVWGVMQFGDRWFFDNGDGQIFCDNAGYIYPGNYYFPDTSLPLYSIDDPGYDGKDYTNKAMKIDGKPGWWRVWAEIPVSILPDCDNFGIWFGFISDKERTYEGAYVDNVKIISIEDVEKKIYQGHSQDWLILAEGMHMFDFPLEWTGVQPGEYRAILKLKNDEGGYDSIKTVDFTIGDEFDCGIVDMEIRDSFTENVIPDGGYMSYTGDAHITFTYHQGGNVAGENIPIHAAAYKLEKDILFEDDFEGMSNWVYFYEDFPLYVSDKFSWSGSKSLAFNNPDTMHYDNNGVYIGYSQDYWSMEGVEEAYMDLYYKGVLADSGDALHMAFTAYRYIIYFNPPIVAGPLCQTSWIGPMQPQCTYIGAINIKSIFDLLAGYGYFFDDNGHMTYEMGLGFLMFTSSSGVLYESCTTEWSGVYVDDISIWGRLQGELVWEDNMVLPGPCEPSQTCDNQFEWEDVPTCNYKVCVETLCEGDVDTTNNKICHTFTVVENLEKMSKAESVDLTDCTPEAWCISNICGCEPDPDAYALATNCDTHDVPAGVNDYVAIDLDAGDGCCAGDIDISHLMGGAPPIVYLAEYFTSATPWPPAGWTIPFSEPEWDPYDYAGGAAGEADFYWYYLFSGDFMESPGVNTLGAAALELQFKSFIDNYNSVSYPYNCEVWVTADGMSWTDITPWVIANANVGPDTYQLDITPWIGPATAVRFMFVGDYFGINHWYVDDVIIQEPMMNTMNLDLVYQCDLYPGYAEVVLEVAGYTTGASNVELDLFDSYGDGWDSDFDYFIDAWIDVYINNVYEGSYTCFGSSFNQAFPVVEGDVIKFCYVDLTGGTGAYVDEHFWTVTTADGIVVHESLIPPVEECFTMTAGNCAGCEPEVCPCPPGVLAWTTVTTFTGNIDPATGTDPCEYQYFSANLLNYLDPAWDHMCIRFRLDTTAATGYAYAGPGIGFHIHEITIEELLGPGEDFFDDFEDGDMDGWCVDCVGYASEWIKIDDFTWCNDFPAEPVHGAIVWDTEIEDAYEAYFYGQWMYDIGGGTTIFCEMSADGGNNWYIISKIVGPGSTGWHDIPCTPFDLTPWAGSKILIRVRILNDGSTPTAGSVCVRDFYIAGKQDRTAPSIEMTLSGPSVGPGLYAGPVQVVIKAYDDESNVDIHYILDGTEYVVPGKEAKFTVSDDDGHVIEAWAVDAVGNEGQHLVREFTIDASPPNVAITAPEPGLYLFGNKLLSSSKVFIIGAFDIEATADDAQGVAVVQFLLDGEVIGEDTEAPYHTYCAVKHMGAGTIKAIALDGVGNEASDTLDVTYYKFL